MKIQIEPVQGEVVLIELDEAMVLLNQLQSIYKIMVY